MKPLIADSKQQLYDLIERFLGAAISTEHFCSAYESIYNLELDRSSLTPIEAITLAALFEKVVWHSPFPEERKQIPNYVGDDEIKEAVDLARQSLVTPG